MKKISNILFLYFFVFIMCMGVSFAWYVWKGSEVNVNVNFADLDPYIKYSSTKVNGGTITPSEDYTGGISNDITFNKEENGDNLDVYGHIYLKITSAKSDNVFKASNLKWTLVSVSNNKETEISTGNFVGENVVEGNDPSKMIPANINFNLTKQSDNTTYKVYVWIDENAPMNIDISSQDISVETYAEANSIEGESSKLSELYIRSIEYKEGIITSVGSYSSRYNLTGYMIVNSNTNPSITDSGWTNISGEKSSSEDGYLLTIKPNKTMDTINNICIKNSNNEVYCKSIGKYSDEVDKPTSKLCNDLTYNGYKQQLVKSTSGVGYTLLNKNEYKKTNANLPNEQGYKITATLNNGYVWKDGTSGTTSFYCKIAQKDLTITALDQTINYGDSISQGLNMITSTGLVGKDSIASITLTPSTTEVTDSGTITPGVSAMFNSDGDDTMGNYNITYEKGKLVIKALSIENATITLNPTSYTYDGTAKKPTVTVVLNNKTLVLNTDYSVSYSNNVNAGTATVTVTGKGNYVGTKSTNFTITYKTYTITLNNQSATSAGTTTLYGRYKDNIYLDSAYTKKMTTSANNITIPTKTGYTFGGYYTATNGGGTQLIDKNGYITSSFTSILYSSNVTLYAKWNANTLTFNDKTITKTYNISAQSDTINSASNGTGAYTYSITSGNTNSYFSLSGTTLNIKKGTPARTYTLKVLATDNNSKVTKEATITIKINAYNLSNATIASVSNQKYTGNPITPTPSVTVPLPSGSTTTLTNNTDFTYSYSNNTNIGTATVTVTGKGNYTGTKSTTFMISYKTYTITLDNQSATSAGTTTLYGRYADGIYLDSAYTKKMTTTTNNITVPTRTGYTFGGYYTAINGGGTRLINASGNITPSFTSTLYNSNVTLHAYWKDTTPPSISVTSSVGDNWTNKSDIELNVSYSDNGSGINTSSIYFSTGSDSYIDLGATGESSYTLPYSVVNIQGINVIKFKICDNAGNCSEASTTIKIDRSAPSTPEITNPTNGNWTANNFSLTLSSSDSYSGIAYYQYTYNANATTTGSAHNTTWVTYANSASKEFVTQNFTTERNQLVYIRACDNVGNCSSKSSTYIRIDKTPPNISIENSSGGNWTNSDVTIELTFSDSGSGINASSLYWSTDNKNWTTISNTSTSGYTDTWSADRNSTAYYKICDNVGNCNTADTPIKINKSLTLSLTKGTGVSTIYYKINNNSIQSTTSNLSASLIYGTTYSYYGVPSSGYYMTECTQSNPCTGTVSSSISKTLTAYESVYYLYDSNGNQTGYANTLSNAISSVSSGGEIRASKANSSGAVTISKNVTINPNGWTITMTGVITNSANLTIEGSGTLTNSSSNLIENTGTVTINGPTVRTYGSGHNPVVMKKGTVNLKVGIIQSDFYGITSSSSNVTGAITINITGGTITTNTDGAVSKYVNPITVEGNSSYKATINISGGTLTSKGYGLRVGTYAVANVTGGTISTVAYSSSVCSETIVNKGTLYIGNTSQTADSTNIKIYNSCGGSAVYNMSGSVSYYNSGYLYSGNSAGIYNSGTSNIRSGYVVTSSADSTYGYAVHLTTASGWVSTANGWYYYENGSAVTGWKQISGTYYYFNSSGIMQTGWIHPDSYYYYLNSSGAMQVGSTASSVDSGIYTSSNGPAGTAGWYSFTTSGYSIYVYSNFSGTYLGASSLANWISGTTSISVAGGNYFALMRSNSSCIAEAGGSTTAIAIKSRSASSSGGTTIYVSKSYPDSSSAANKYFVCKYYGTNAQLTCP